MPKIFVAVVVLTVLCLWIIGCSPAHRKKNVSAPEQSSFVYTPGSGDAYLYDVKINLDGRKRSTRLDVYIKDDTLALFARAYLGKGALKAIITKDNSLVYFPTENEYFAGKLSELADGGCDRHMEIERILIDLFHKRPVDFIYDSTDYYVVILHESKESCRYKLVSVVCKKSMEIDYEYRDGRYIPVFLGFSQADGSLSIEARRRSQSLNINIPAEKFSLPIPGDASALEP